MDEKQTFEYTYSAQQQEEIAAIRKKYLPPEQQMDKLEQLRALDAGVTRKGMIVSLVCGVLGALVMGTGMSLIMTDLARLLGLASGLIPGLILGTLGMAGVIAAYPLYHRITQTQRQRIAPQILKLTEELSK